MVISSFNIVFGEEAEPSTLLEDNPLPPVIDYTEPIESIVNSNYDLMEYFEGTESIDYTDTLNSIDSNLSIITDYVETLESRDKTQQEQIALLTAIMYIILVISGFVLIIYLYYSFLKKFI